jgi:nucleotide-binding universal stress UspA family protein
MNAQFNTIVFPVDFSDRCRGAAHYVEAFAGRFGSRLILLHVVETTIGQPGDLNFGGLAALQYEDREARAEEMLRAFQSEELGNLTSVERRVETGDPGRTIVRVARKENADLIMMPTHGYGGFRRFILGSITAKVLHDADCAVWTGVHMENAPPLENIAVRRILCALDLVNNTDRLIRFASALAEEYGAELILCHAVPGSEAMPERVLDRELRRHLLSQAREQLQALVAASTVPARFIVEIGEVSRVVDEAAQSSQADLLVIGRGQHSGLGRLRTHSYAIIRESPCPVLSI